MKESVPRCLGSGSPVEGEGGIPRHGRNLLPWLVIPLSLLVLSSVDANRSVGVSAGGYRPHPSLGSIRRFFQLGLRPGGIVLRRVDEIDPFVPSGVRFFSEIDYGIAPGTPLDGDSIDRLIEDAGTPRVWLSRSPLLQSPVDVSPWNLEIRFWFLGVLAAVLWFLLLLKLHWMDAHQRSSRAFLP